VIQIIATEPGFLVHEDVQDGVSPAVKVFGAVDVEVDITSACPPVPRRLLTNLLPEYDTKALESQQEDGKPHWLVNAQRRECQRLHDLTLDLSDVKFIVTE